MSTITPSFAAGGLASGLDSNSIIEGLTKLQQQPITLVQKQQSGLRAQVSTLGDIASKLGALASAAKALGADGVLGVKATSANASFAAVPGSGALAGSYAVEVEQLASAAKQRSAGFAAAEKVSGGSLDLVVDGKHYAAPPEDANGNAQPWADGASLETVANAIRASGAPVTATVLFDGTASYLSVTRRDTGFTGTAAEALVITQSDAPAGTAGKPLALAWLKDDAGEDLLPTNARFVVDGLSFTRTSNTVVDALPGSTLTLRSPGGAEPLTLENDVDATRKKLQTYVDAYNAVAKVVQAQLSPAENTDRAAMLSGSTALRALQQKLQSLGSLTVPGTSTVRSLAELGVKTNRDGTLTIDDKALASAVARDPASIDALFSKAAVGIAATVARAVDDYVDPVDGFLTKARSSLDGTIRRMDDQVARMQARVDTYRATLQAQFAAMEQVVSQYKGIGTFLQNQASAQQQNK